MARIVKFTYSASCFIKSCTSPTTIQEFLLPNSHQMWTNASPFHTCVKEDSAPTQSAVSPVCVPLDMCCLQTRLVALVSVD